MPESGKQRTTRALFASALRSIGPSFEARGLFLLLASYGNADGSNIFPSVERLAVDTGHNVKWVKRRLNELHQFAWITHKWKGLGKGNGKVNIYSLHWAQIGPDRNAYNGPILSRYNGPKTGPRHSIHIPESPEDESSPFRNGSD